MGDHLADLVLAESSTEGNEFVDTASEAFVFRMGGFHSTPRHSPSRITPPSCSSFFGEVHQGPWFPVEEDL